MRDLLETTCQVKAGRNLVGHALNMGQTILSRGENGLLVKAHGLKFPASYSCDSPSKKTCAAFEILRAILRPYFELSMVRGQCLKLLPLLVRMCGIAARG